jgi:hypothetical protein
MDDLDDFLDQLGTPRTPCGTGVWNDIELDGGETVIEANDDEHQPFFTIAQRLRATYLKDEG